MAEMPDYDPKNPRCDQEQFAMLKRCSEARDMSEWNNWRDENIHSEIYLQRIRLFKAYLVDANLHSAHFEGAKLQMANFKGAYLQQIYLNDADLIGAHFEQAIIQFANLENAKLESAIFNDARLEFTNLKRVHLSKTYFMRANLWEAHLENVEFFETNLKDAKFRFTHLNNTYIHKSNLIGTDFTGAIVNSETIIRDCMINNGTNFAMVGLDSARVEPSLLAALKTNIRRIRWEKYFKKHSKSCLGKISIAPMRLFWWLSDYGSSSVRIGLSILIAILFFTDVYLIIGIYAPSVISLPNQGNITSDIIPVSDSYIRIICFTISTMVTLGFGGINVTIDKAFQGWSNFAFLAVTFNLVLGYLFLSVLVTRLGILFQSQAPEQKTRDPNHTYFYQIALILLTIGLDVVNINNKITYTKCSFGFNLLNVILNILAICFSFYLLCGIFKYSHAYLWHKIKLFFRFIRYKNTISKNNN